MTHDELRELDVKIKRNEAEIADLELDIRHVRAKLRVRRDCRAMECGARMARRESESSEA